MRLEEINELSIAIIKAIGPIITEVTELRESVKQLAEQVEVNKSFTEMRPAIGDAVKEGPKQIVL